MTPASAAPVGSPASSGAPGAPSSPGAPGAPGPLVFVVAGEASGDVLGARLIARLRAARPELRFAGIGGERMAEQGVDSLFPMRELSLMGLLEVLPQLRNLRRRMAQARAAVLAARPAVLVCVDAPSFGLRLAAGVRGAGLPVAQYVAPQVWAWRPWRVRKIAARVDAVLCLLPFEPPFFRAAGIAAEFVGHPVLEGGADRGSAARFRDAHGLAPGERPVLVMPGSRRGEVERLLPVFGAALRRLADAVPGLRPVVPLAAGVEEAVRAAAASWHPAPILLRDAAEKHDAYAAAREAGGVGLIKSGTSSLEVALAGVPMVVGYRANPVTALVVKRLLRVRFASIVNLLAGREVIPEFLQERCEPAALSAALSRLLRDPAAAAAQRAGFDAVLGELRPGDLQPSAAAAAAVLRLIEGRADHG